MSTHVQHVHTWWWCCAVGGVEGDRAIATASLAGVAKAWLMAQARSCEVPYIIATKALVIMSQCGILVASGNSLANANINGHVGLLHYP